MDADARATVACVYMLEPFFGARETTLFILLMGVVIFGGAFLSAWLAPAVAAASPVVMAWISSIGAAAALAAAAEPVIQAGQIMNAAARQLADDVARAQTERDLRAAGQGLGEELARALLIAGPALADAYGAARLATLRPPPRLGAPSGRGRGGGGGGGRGARPLPELYPDQPPLVAPGVGARIRGRLRVIAGWQQNGTTLVKVWPARVTPEMRAVGARVTPEPAEFSTGSDVYREFSTATGYVTEERHISGKTAEQIAEMMGLGAPYRVGDFGIEIARLQRLPEVDEFRIASPGGYTTVPAREPIGSPPHAPDSPESELWPPGTGAPQYRLENPIPVDPPIHLGPGETF